jgi:phospholipid transport system transporter-binding protein
VNQASIVEQQPGVLALTGVLDYRSGPALREQGARLIGASTAADCAIDCSAVEKSSSVGLALLLAFTRDARSAGKTLSIRGLPADMLKIAQVCALDGILPLAK